MTEFIKMRYYCSECRTLHIESWCRACNSCPLIDLKTIEEDINKKEKELLEINDRYRIVKIKKESLEQALKDIKEQGTNKMKNELERIKDTGDSIRSLIDVMGLTNASFRTIVLLLELNLPTECQKRQLKLLVKESKELLSKIEEEIG